MGGKEHFAKHLDSLFTMEIDEKYIAKHEDITRDGIIGNYVHGNKQGEWKYYNNFGQLTSIETYKNGVLDGSYIDYHETGKKRLEITYENDEVNSKVTWYDEFENISEENRRGKNNRQR